MGRASIRWDSPIRGGSSLTQLISIQQKTGDIKLPTPGKRAMPFLFRNPSHNSQARMSAIRMSHRSSYEHHRGQNRCNPETEADCNSGRKVPPNVVVFTNSFGSFDGKNGIPTIRRPPVFIAMSFSTAAPGLRKKAGALPCTKRAFMN